MTPTKSTCYVSVLLYDVADSLVAGGLLGTHGRTKRVSCLRRICTDFTFIPSLSSLSICFPSMTMFINSMCFSGPSPLIIPLVFVALQSFACYIPYSYPLYSIVPSSDP